jgi:hypothetical protein
MYDFILNYFIVNSSMLFIKVKFGEDLYVQICVIQLGRDCWMLSQQSNQLRFIVQHCGFLESMLHVLMTSRLL